MGLPGIESEDMPDIAANSLSIAFGDFGSGYPVVDRAGVQNFEAIKPMKFAVS